MRLQKDLDVRRCRTQRMHQRLEDSDTIFRTVPLPSQGRECKPVRCAIGQVKTAVGIEVLVLRVFRRLRAAATMPRYSFCVGGSVLSRSILTRLSSSGLLTRGDRVPNR